MSNDDEEFKEPEKEVEEYQEPEPQQEREPEPIQYQEQQGRAQYQDPELKKIPENTLDFNMEILNPVWGKEEYISQDLKDKLSTITYYQRPNGSVYADKKSLYGILSHYTRDMRLANIDRAQLVYCSYYIDLAGDFLQVDQVEPFLICLSRSATQLELSQSRDGFLRKRQTTLTTEEYKKDLEPGKKSLLTGRGK